MAQKPTFIDLGSKPDNMFLYGPSSSPRVTHVAGDVPPAMSPLDAFAAQSRLLSKQLDDSRRNGRRVSRLPPLTVANSLAKPRPGYFRSTSTDTESSATGDEARPVPDDPPGNRMEVEEPRFRPKSYYPRMSRVPPLSNGQAPYAASSPLVNDLTPSTPQEQHSGAPGDYFGVVRAQSPDSAPSVRKSMDSSERSFVSKSQSSFDSYHHAKESQRGLSAESVSPRGQYLYDLRPPKLPYANQTPGTRSVAADSSDDEISESTPGSSVSQPRRKFSSGSGFSTQQSPLSPLATHHRRSTSGNSDHSINGHRLSRPAFNFSRPLSRGSRLSIDSSSRQPSSDRQAQQLPEPTVQSPISVDNEEFFDTKEHPMPQASSYIYAKYSLPRGRMLERDSLPLDGTVPSSDQDLYMSLEDTKPAVSKLITTDVSISTPPRSLESEISVVEPPPPRRSMDQIETRRARH